MKLPMSRLQMLSLVFVAIMSTLASSAAGQDAKSAPLAMSSRIYSVAEAIQASKVPVKQMVFHYDEKLDAVTISAILSQTHALKERGYRVVSVPGGPASGVKMYVEGEEITAIFSKEDILEKTALLWFSKVYYDKWFGRPAGWFTVRMTGSHPTKSIEWATKAVLVVGPGVPDPIKKRFIERLVLDGINNAEIFEDGTMPEKTASVYFAGQKLEVTTLGRPPKTEFRFVELPSVAVHVQEFVRANPKAIDRMRYDSAALTGCLSK